MSRLLRADVARLWKSKTFWVCLFILCLYAIYMPLQIYYNLRDYPDYCVTLEEMLFNGMLSVQVVIAIFIGLFVGTQYSDGFLRNKLIIGHARVAVYGSNLIVVLIAITIMDLAVSVLSIVIYRLLVGGLSGSITVFTVLYLCEYMALAACGALFLLISMAVSSKAVGSVVVVVTAFVLLIAAIDIEMRLNSISHNGEEVYVGAGDNFTYAYIDGEGNVVEVEITEDTPHYMTGKKRERYEFLYDFLPSGQSVQFISMVKIPDDMVKFPLYSMSIMIATSVCGVFIFCKKNVK